MSIFSVGRVCVKLAGRDAGKKCVVVEQVDDMFVVVDGATRRRKVNVKHLEPLAKTVDIKAKASTADVAKALGIEVKATKPKKAGERPRKQRKVKAKKAKPAKKEAAQSSKATSAESKTPAPKAEKKPAKKEVPKKEAENEEVAKTEAPKAEKDQEVYKA